MVCAYLMEYPICHAREEGHVCTSFVLIIVAMITSHQCDLLGCSVDGSYTHRGYALVL